MKTLKDEPSLPSGVQIKEEKPNVLMEMKKTSNKPLIAIHPTVNEMFHLYPHIKLPKICLHANVHPFVTMQMGKVESYFKERNLNFEEHCGLALKPPSVTARTNVTARKRTMASPKAKSTRMESPLCPINEQIIRQDVEDTDKGILRAIKIKIGPNIPTKENLTDEPKDLSAINEAESSEQQTEKSTPCHKKRKLSESPTKENDKPGEAGHDSTNSLEISKLSYVTNEYVQYICNVCDTVHHSSKDLRKHRNKHLRCQFCKTIFQSLESKTHHLDGKCLNKNTINNFPSIELSKIENNLDIVKKYPKAFVDFSPKIDTPKDELFKIPSRESEPKHSELSPKPVKAVVTENIIDIIEILSDDDDNIPSTAPNIVPVIKPVLKIKNSEVLDIIDSNSNEVITLKNLLSHNTSLKLSAEKSIQTDIPDQQDIQVNKSQLTAMLAMLKQHLHIFRVPIEVKKGPFDVSYSYTDKPKPNNLQLWSDLTPMDITKNKTKVATAAPYTNGTKDSLPTCDIVTGEANKLSAFTSEIIPLSVVEENRINVKNIVPKNDSSRSTTCENSCDKNFSSSCDSEATTSQPNFSKPISSTYSRISILGPPPISAFPSGKESTPQLTCTSTYRNVDISLEGHSTPIPISLPISTQPSKSSTMKGMITSPSSTSTTATVIQRETTGLSATSSVTTYSVLHPVLSNTPPLKSVDSRTYPVSLVKRTIPSINNKTTTNNPLVNIPVAPTPAVAIPPNTHVLNGTNMSTLASISTGSRNPVNFKIPYKKRHRPVILNSSNSLNTLSKNSENKQTTSRSTSNPLSGLKDASQRPQTPLFTHNNHGISTCTVTGSVKQQLVATSVWPPTNSFNHQVSLNTSLPSTSELPSIHSVGYSNVPVMVVNSKSETSTIASGYSSTGTYQLPPPSLTTANTAAVSRSVTPSNYASYFPIPRQINARRSSFPYTPYTSKSVRPPAYLLAYNQTPSQAVSDRRKSYSTPPNVHFSENTRHSAKTPNLMNNNCYNTNVNTSTATNFSSDFQTSSSSLTFGQVSPATCSASSTAAPQQGHIRVRTIQELT